MIQKAKTQNIRVCSKERFIGQEGINQEDGSLNGASNPSCWLEQDKDLRDGGMGYVKVLVGKF